MFSSFSTHGRLIKLWFWNNSRVISYWTNGVYWRVVYILRLPGWHEVQYPVCPMLWCSHSKVLCSSLKSTFGWVVEDFHKTISSRFLYDISKTFLSASLSLFVFSNNPYGHYLWKVPALVLIFRDFGSLDTALAFLQVNI